MIVSGQFHVMLSVPLIGDCYHIKVWMTYFKNIRHCSRTLLKESKILTIGYIFRCQKAHFHSFFYVISLVANDKFNVSSAGYESRFMSFVGQL